MIFAMEQSMTLMSAQIHFVVSLRWLTANAQDVGASSLRAAPNLALWWDWRRNVALGWFDLSHLGSSTKPDTHSVSPVSSFLATDPQATLPRGNSRCQRQRGFYQVVRGYRLVGKPALVFECVNNTNWVLHCVLQGSGSIVIPPCAFSSIKSGCRARLRYNLIRRFRRDLGRRRRSRSWTAGAGAYEPSSSGWHVRARSISLFSR